MVTTLGTGRSRVHSRRSSTSLNLTNMSLFPLTSTSVLDLDENSFSRNSDRHSKSPGPKLRNGSYIQHTSSPTTPGILSPNPSSYFTPVSPSAHTQRSGSSTPTTARSRRNSNHNLAQAQDESYISDLPKSKSTTQLYGDSHASNVWMHRTGAALSSEIREFKGQSWLISRASSTSLVDENWMGGEGDDWRTRRERGRSRTAARSMAGSRSRGVSREQLGREYASENEEEEEGEEEEFEVETDDEEYLYREKGYGLGMWVDRIIGWSFFSADEDEDEEDYRRGEGRRKMKPTQPQSSPKVIPSFNTVAAMPLSTRQHVEDESWGDPSWAFSIATQVLF